MKITDMYLIPPRDPVSPHIGDDYQAEIPDYTLDYSPNKNLSYLLTKEVILWSPTNIRQLGLDQFILKVSSITNIHSPFLHIEKLLYFLKEFNYKTDVVLEYLEQICISRHLSKDCKSSANDEFRRAELAQMYHEGEVCVKCKDGGSIILCDHESCSLAYHNYCVNLNNLPDAHWVCPAHNCAICNEKTSNSWCLFCGTNRCDKHLIEDNETEQNNSEFLLNIKGTEDFKVCQTCFNEDSLKLKRNAFLYRLHTFSSRNGRTIKHIPYLGNRCADLYELFKSVINNGGFKRILERDLWNNIAEQLTIPCNKSNFNSIKNIYYDLIYNYEFVFMKREKRVNATWKIAKK